MADNNNLMGSTMAVAVTAAILSPRVRGILHAGAVQGLAGVLIAGDAVASFARGVGRGIQSADAAPRPDASATEAARKAAQAAQKAAGAPRNSSRPRKSATTRRKPAASEGGS